MSAATGLGAIISAAATFTVVHCCAPSVPFGMIKGAGADGAGCDLSKLRRVDEDALAEAVEAGLGPLAGVLPAIGPPAFDDAEGAGAPQPPSARQTAAPGLTRAT